MSQAERTRQQLDPAGSLGSRQFSVTMAVGAFLYAIVMSVLGGEGGDPWLAILALAFLGAASTVVIAGTHPMFAPFERWRHLAVHGLVLAAVGCSIAGHWGQNLYIQDDWGPISLGLLIMAMGSFRPSSELMVMGLVSAMFLGFLTLLQAPVLPANVPVILYVLVTIMPVIGLSAAAASYGRVVVGALVDWDRSSREAQRGSVAGLLTEIERSVQQDRITILGQEVVPFFRELLDRGTITDQDRAYAAAISDEIREVMVAEVNRTWLDLFAAQVSQRWATTTFEILDASRSASGMSMAQRTALRALVVALFEEPAFQRGSLRVELQKNGGGHQGTLTADLLVTDSLFRSLFAPYAAVMRVVFRETTVDFRVGRLTVTFSYERR